MRSWNLSTELRFAASPQRKPVERAGDSICYQVVRHQQPRPTLPDPPHPDPPRPLDHRTRPRPRHPPHLGPHPRGNRTPQPLGRRPGCRIPRPVNRPGRGPPHRPCRHSQPEDATYRVHRPAIPTRSVTELRPRRRPCSAGSLTRCAANPALKGFLRQVAPSESSGYLGHQRSTGITTHRRIRRLTSANMLSEARKAGVRARAGRSR